MARSTTDKPEHKGSAVPTGKVGRFARVARMATGVAGGMIAEGTRQLRAGKRPRLIRGPLNGGACLRGGVCPVLQSP